MTLELQLLRVEETDDYTFGLLFDDTAVREFLCETLEDESRVVKLPGETRIPAGRYELKLRTEGGMDARYVDRFPEIHRGMIHLQDVPNFEFIYIHIGNREDETEGCILVGETNEAQRAVGFLSNSRLTYLRIYKRITDAIEDGEAFINIVDMKRS